MTSATMVYYAHATFRAPLAFSYAWCTDYSTEDRKLEGDTGWRQILRKNSRTVVYEDLNATPHGWMWSRQTVTLQPPNRWHATAVGNYRTWLLDYALRELPDGRTEFTMRGERRATALGGKNPSKAVLEEELTGMWATLGRNLERDYRARQRKRSGNRRSR